MRNHRPIKRVGQQLEVHDQTQRLQAALVPSALSRIIRPVAALTTLLCVASAAPSPARAGSVALAPLANVAQRLTAYDGYVVFSQDEPNTSRWRLMVWHAGAITPLDVPARSMPFDASAGPGAGGRPMVVYSRCKRDPPASAAELAGNEYMRELDWTRARGCRIYELALPSGSPRPVRGIHANGASDSTPAIWKGEIAFARMDGRAHVAKVYIWQRAQHRLVRVGGGSGPCPSSASRCERRNGEPPSAWVDGMSLNASVLSYEWSTSTASFGESPFPELRVDPLRGARQSAPSQIIAERFASGTCGFAEGVSPSVTDESVLYTEIEGDCGATGGGPEEIRSSFESYSTEPRRWHSAAGGPGVIAAIAEDRSTTYWISDAPKAASPLEEQNKCRPGYAACFEPAFSNSQDCAPAHGTCTLMETTGIVFGRPEVRRPG
jgi:hypothetical protein